MAWLLEDALACLLAKTTLLDTVARPLSECYKLVLAEDIISPIDFPPFDRSPLDGYAVRAADVAAATARLPVLLRQVDNIAAGSWPRQTVQPGTASRIMTGAKLPDGADGVIRLEDTSVQGDVISIYCGRSARDNICRQGEEVQAGTVVLTKGTVLNEGALGLLAMLGIAKPLVYRQPTVAVLATGSELIGVEEALAPGKIRNSNSYMLLGKIKEAGAIPILLGHAVDNLATIHQQLVRCEPADVYITTGGASVGDYDLMAQLFAKLDIPILFSRLAIKPGMPVLAGFWQGRLFVALSGNPAAANVSFEVLLRPVLKKMAGYASWERPVVQAKLKRPFYKTIQSRRFIPAVSEWIDGQFYAEPIQFQGNGMLVGVQQANALIDVVPGGSPLEQGTEVTIRLLTE